MLSGVVDSDNLPQVLRDISQKRRQGILEIRHGDAVTEIHFILGKIVEVVESGASPSAEVFDILQFGGAVPEDCVCAPEGTYASILKQMGQTENSAEVFRRVLKHRALNKLYTLNLSSGGVFQFKTQMVECERELVPSISVGQFLLDVVALATDHGSFQEAFPEGVVIVATHIDSATSLSEEEEIILGLCNEPRSLDEIAQYSMLSRFHIQESLLSLKERGIIDVRLGEVESLGGELDGVEPEIQIAQSTKVDSTDPSIIQLPARPGFRARVRVVNGSLLHSNLVPGLVAFGFLLASILVPTLFWREIFGRF